VARRRRKLSGTGKTNTINESFIGSWF